MRSTIQIANDLDKIISLLTQKTEELVEDDILIQQLRNISGSIGIIGIFNGLDTSKKNDS